MRFCRQHVILKAEAEGEGGKSKERQTSVGRYRSYVSSSCKGEAYHVPISISWRTLNPSPHFSPMRLTLAAVRCVLDTVSRLSTIPRFPDLHHQLVLRWHWQWHYWHLLVHSYSLPANLTLTTSLRPTKPSFPPSLCRLSCRRTGGRIWDV